MRLSYPVCELHRITIEEILESGDCMILKSKGLSLTLKREDELLQDYRNGKEIEVSGNFMAEHEIEINLFPPHFHFRMGEPQVLSGEIDIDGELTYRFSRSDYKPEKIKPYEKTDIYGKSMRRFPRSSQHA